MDESRNLFSIKVFAQIQLNEISPGKLREDLLNASFGTLCQQYGLKDSLIEETRQNLEILFPSSPKAPYFVVKYQSVGGRPIIVHQWSCLSDEGKSLLGMARQPIHRDNMLKQLISCSSIFSIDLHSSQLRTMGLLLGYEIARWIGFYGNGLVRDLHGDWYTLNQHQAFIPMAVE